MKKKMLDPYRGDVKHVDWNVKEEENEIQSDTGNAFPKF